MGVAGPVRRLVLDVGDQALDEEIGVVGQRDGDGHRLCRSGEGSAMTAARSSSGAAELTRPVSAMRARRSSAASGNSLRSAFADRHHEVAGGDHLGIAGPVGVDRLAGRPRRSSVSVLTVKAGSALMTMSVTRKTRNGEREQDRGDAVGAEARLGAVALAGCAARAASLRDVDRARGEPVGGDVSHTVPDTCARRGAR